MPLRRHAKPLPDIDIEPPNSSHRDRIGNTAFLAALSLALLRWMI